MDVEQLKKEYREAEEYVINLKRQQEQELKQLERSHAAALDEAKGKKGRALVVLQKFIQAVKKQNN